MLHAEEQPVLFTGFEMTGAAALAARNISLIYPSYELESRIYEYYERISPGTVGIIGNEIILHKVYEVIRKASGGMKIIDCNHMLACERWIKT